MWRLALLLAACGGLSSHPSAAGWSEVTSEHFAMWTDGDVRDARETLTSFEHKRSIILGVAFPTLDSHRRTLVIGFRDKNEVSHFLPDQFAAQTWTQSPLMEPVIIMAADANAHDELILTHELTHAVSYQFIHRQPAWFAEGLATFFETITLDLRDANVVVGEPSPGRLKYVQRRALDPVADALACVKIDCRTPEFYTTAWALMTFLMNERATELARYELALGTSPKIPPWTEIVPELGAEELQHQLAMWLLRGHHTVWRYHLEPRPWPTTVRALPEADVHAVEGMLLVRLHPDEARAELATAVQLEPTNLVANLAIAARDKGLPLDAARALVAAHGGDWRAWRLLGLAMRAAHDPGERDAHEHVCALLAKDPRADPPAGLTCATVSP